MSLLSLEEFERQSVCNDIAVLILVKYKADRFEAGERRQ